MLRCPSLLVCGLVVAGCATAPSTAQQDAPQYLGQMRIAHGAPFDGTVIGGLSGISYDVDSDLYYVISDDRSAHSSARFYTARIRLSDNRIDGVDVVATYPLLDRGGQPFPPLDASARPPVVPPDPEGIAVDGARRLLYWSSEGERDGALVRDPSVRIATLDGSYVGEFVLPDMLRMTDGPTGPRQNRALEGLTLTPDGRHLWAAMEGPGHQDGALPTAEAGTLTRITRFDVETRTATAQYAYPLEKVRSGPRGDNGLTDLVALDEQNFLAVERGYGDRVQAGVYRVSVGDAEDVLGRPSLQGPPPRTMTKTLLLGLPDAVDPIDNIEGITLGPALPDGRRALILVSDDNFAPRQLTQIVAFAF
ncbi:esterase-like activity of phytase family protein [Mycobacterium sp. B14F4]|uniref:esterase-like activity of phytase family protein n=1 Tax=Mycobacterium sp. B14F4 TaxID=3153565 RepID=UPI00325CF0EC